MFSPLRNGLNHSAYIYPVAGAAVIGLVLRSIPNAVGWLVVSDTFIAVPAPVAPFIFYTLDRLVRRAFTHVG